MSHQVILRIKVVLGNEHRCERFDVSGADRTQLNTKFATQTLSILLGSIFLGVRSWSDPEVSFLVYQQVAEGYPADSRGVVLYAKKGAKLFFGCPQRQRRIGRKVSHARNYLVCFPTVAKSRFTQNLPAGF